MGTNNISIVRDFIEEIWNKGNVAMLDRLVSERCSFEAPITGEMRGRDAIRDRVQQFRSAFPDLVVTIEDVQATDDRVVTRWVARATHKGPFMGISPTNRRGEVRGISTDRIVDGRLVEHHEVFDTLALFQVIGAVPALDRLLKNDGQRAAAPPPR